MQVKDYLQSLSDDNKIHVEKIGSGNWYWSFTGDEKRSNETQLDKLRIERDNLAASVTALQQKLDEATTAREDGNDDEVNDAESSRQSLLQRHERLEKEMGELKSELAMYCDNDPVELEKRKNLVQQCKEEAMQWTDQILGLESWLCKQTAGDKEQLLMIKRSCYGDEFDEDEGTLREIF